MPDLAAAGLKDLQDTLMNAHPAPPWDFSRCLCCNNTHALRLALRELAEVVLEGHEELAIYGLPTEQFERWTKTVALARRVVGEEGR